MDIEGARNEVLRKALAHIDTDYSKGMEKAVPTKLRIYGVRIPMLRSVVREWKKQNPTASQEEILQLVQSLRHGGSREENILALMLVSNHRGLTEKLSWNDFLSWGRTLDNWETIDSLGGTLGEWVLDKPDERLPRLYELVEQNNVWLRRLGVVATVYLNRGKKGTAFPSETFMIIDKVKKEKHIMISKAISWTLRALSTADKAGVARYLDENGGILPAHVVREVRSKLLTGKKN